MESRELDELYSEVILDHCRHPRNREEVPAPDIRADGVNPFCGDEVHLQIALDGQGRVARVGLQGKGCSINQASGSMLTEAIVHKTLSEAEDVARLFRAMMSGAAPADERLGELKALEEVQRYPVRIKCALLAWSTLEEGIEDYRRQHG